VADVSLSACPQISEIDLREFDRHPNAETAGPVTHLPMMSANPPFVKLLGAHQVIGDA
jgi:hypothetical protein